MQVRQATTLDADAISRVIVAALRETNATDHAPEVIDAVVASFTPEHVRSRLTSRAVLIATRDGQVVGTAALEGGTVRSVFVSPRHQGAGVGVAPMAAVERLAASQGCAVLCVPSSVTAQGFYRKLGFVAERDEFCGSERTIIMTKSLPGEPHQHDPQ